MEFYLVREAGFQGCVRLSSSGQNCKFYRYVLSRGAGGQVYDGAAGDLSEALDNMRAHIRYLSIRKWGSAARE